MLVLLKLGLVAIFVLSAVAAFHKWLDYIEQRRIVVTWSRFFLWLWTLASAAWIGPMILLGFVHGGFFRTPLAQLKTIALYGVLPALLTLAVGLLIARTRRGLRFVAERANRARTRKAA